MSCIFMALNILHYKSCVLIFIFMNMYFVYIYKEKDDILKLARRFCIIDFRFASLFSHISVGKEWSQAVKVMS